MVDANNAVVFCTALWFVIKWIVVPTLGLLVIGFVCDLIDVTIGERLRKKAKRHAAHAAD